MDVFNAILATAVEGTTLSDTFDQRMRVLELLDFLQYEVTQELGETIPSDWYDLLTEVLHLLGFFIEVTAMTLDTLHLRPQR